MTFTNIPANSNLLSTIKETGVFEAYIYKTPEESIAAAIKIESGVNSETLGKVRMNSRIAEEAQKVIGKKVDFYVLQEINFIDN